MAKHSSLDELIHFLQQCAPTLLAEDWDNVGLLVGHADQPIASVMTCLTLTPDVADEAIHDQAQLIVTHHPVLFRPIQRLTNQTPEGRMLLELIAAGIAVYSPHTGYDSSKEGINQQLAELFELHDVDVLRPNSSETDPAASSSEDDAADTEPLGSGRCGTLAQPATLRQLTEAVKSRLAVEYVQYVGDEEHTIRRMAIACGAAAEFLHDAARLDCQVLLTGEARFHACLEALACDVALILPGHYATERPAMEQLARKITTAFPSLTVWPSRSEHDPVQWA